MKKLTVLSAAILLAASSAAFADHHMKGEAHSMKMLDTNKDGMISKEEFTKHHEMMWDNLKKNSAGMVDVKELEAMHKKMPKDEKK
jgi:hypothetical protein